MCGFAGVLHRNGRPVDLDLVEKMGGCLVHRGPDRGKAMTDGPVGLAFRRLSIIDLSAAGDQPMTTPDGRYTIVYNGEIYNFRELRAELEARGVRFVSRSDTEVLLAAFSIWGLECLNRLNGMFAFAIWDRADRKLTLARDRYGIKPLYYVEMGDCLVFGSEIKALIAHPELSVEICPEGLSEYVAFQNIFTNRSLFKGIFHFPRASYAQAACANGSSSTSLSTHPYWQYGFQEPTQVRDVEDCVEEGRHLIRQATERQLVSDVPVGSYLSGGIDSGSITRLASEHLPGLHTFTCGFDLTNASGIELAFDERDAARELSGICQSVHHEVVLKSGDMERALPRLTYHLDEPRVGQSYPNYYVSELASQSVKVVLSGSGGDEFFGGYPWRYHTALAGAPGDYSDYIDRYYGFWQRLIPEARYQEVIAPMGISGFSPRDIFRSVLSPGFDDISQPEDALNACMTFEASTFLQGLLLVEDKISMSYGLETRLPFLDNDLVDFAMKLPANMKLRDLDQHHWVNENAINKAGAFFQNTGEGKLLLREIMTKFLPASFANRTKQGFSAPDASWFKGDSIEYVKRRLMNNDARIYNYLDRGTLQGLVQEHLDGHVNRRLLIWSLLSLEEWCDGFLS